MPRYKILLFLYCVLSCIFVCLTDSRVCYPPNRPLGGDYSPQKETYRVGDLIKYSCGTRFFPLTLNSSEHTYSECQNSGTWSAVQDTFCDGPSLTADTMLMKEGKSTMQQRKIEASKVHDGIIDSCYYSSYVDRITWRYNFSGKTLISAVRIYGLIDERYRLEVIVQEGSLFGWNQISCGFQDFIMGRNRYIIYRCPEGTWGDKVFIKDWTRTEHILTICEVEIFSKTKSSCGPPDVSIPNGYLVYERASAHLTCASGYKRTSTQRILCAQSLWLTDGHFCVPDEESSEDYGNSMVLILSALGTIALLVIILTIIILMCRRKRHPERTPSISVINSTVSYFSNPSQCSRECGMNNSQSLETDDDPDEHEYSTMITRSYFQLDSSLGTSQTRQSTQ